MAFTYTISPGQPFAPLEDITLSSRDHPKVAGELQWTIDVPLDDGRTLHLRLGRKGRDGLLECLLRENADDAAEMMGRPLPPFVHGPMG